MGEVFARAVLRARWVILILCAAVTAGALVASARVDFDASVDIWFVDDDPELETYHRFLRAFGTDEIAVVGVFADDVFAPDVMDRIRRMTGAVEHLPHVGRVRSLTNATVLAQGDDLGLLPLSDVADPRARALSDPLLPGVLVAKDGTATAILIELSTTARDFETKVALVAAIRDVVEPEARDDLRVIVGGTPAVNEAVFRYSRRDFSTLGLLAILLVVAISYAAFRRPSATLLPLAVVVLAVVWTFGLMGALDLHLDLVSQSLAVVIFAVGVADAVHVMAEYQRRTADGLDEHRALEGALASLLLPCLFTTVTTAAGMASLAGSSLAPIRRFGLLAATGVMFALVLSLTFLPAVLSLLPAPKVKSAAPALSPWLARLASPAATTRRFILAVAALSVAAAVFSLGTLHVGANPMAYFREGDPVKEEITEIDRRLGGSTSIEMLVTAPDGGLADPMRLERLVALETWLEQRPAVERVLSVTDGLVAMNGAVTGTRAVPNSPEAVAQLYLLMEEDEGFEAMVKEERSLGRISARVRMADAASLVGEIPAIDAKLAREYSGPDLTVEPTGFVKLISEMEIYIVDSQVKSLSGAFLLVTLLMMILLRSLKLGLFAMIPNLMPVLLGLGFMAVAGIKLDPGTAMIGSITLGLVVDDTVHVMVRLRQRLQAGAPLEEAIREAIGHAGRAVVITSVILAAGFGVLAFGSFTPNVYLGLVSAVVIGLALICDLVVLPAALLAIRPKL